MRTLVVLCAGRGTRLEPLTAERPKCLVPLHDRPLLGWQLAAARQVGVERIVLAGGYRAEALQGFGAEVHLNPEWATSNMVETLWSVRQAIQGELLLSYGDIVFAPALLRALLDAAPPEGVAVVVDRAWRGYWEARFADPLADAETLRLDPAGRLLEIGQRPRSLDEVEAQYIGLTRWSEAAWRGALALFQGCREGARPNPWPRAPRLWYVTDLLQTLIDEGRAVQAVPVQGGWLEVDTPRDLRLAGLVSRVRGELLEIAASRRWPDGEAMEEGGA